jgi:Domain of unknown function (DUF1906)
VIVQPAFVGARGTDSVTLLSADAAENLRASSIDFVLQYLGSATAQGVQGILASGLAFMPVTYANRFDGAATVEALHALGLPQGTTVWLDVEEVKDDAPTTKAKINGWARDVLAAGFQPGLYVGADVGLTSLELYSLAVVRYWRSMSRILDRFGALAEPACGFCMEQCYDTVTWGGIRADIDFVRKDWRERLPNWVRSAA